MKNFLEQIKTEIQTNNKSPNQNANHGDSQDFSEPGFGGVAPNNLINLILGSTGSFNKGYHLEFAIHDIETATTICNELATHDIFAHMSNNPVRVYIKDSQSICNLLALVGAHKSLCELTDAIVMRSVTNSSNRKTNCDTHNIAKQTETASKQIEKIFQLMESDKFLDLPQELQDTARARIENVDATYDELASILGISKSALAHRMKRMLSFMQ